HEGYAATTVNMWCGSVAPVFTWAQAKGLLDDQPFAGLGKLRAPRREIHIYDRDGIEAILFACPDDLARATVLAGLASLRIGEVQNLTRGDVDFDRQVITVQPKPESATTWRWDVKDIERRTVPLPDQLATLLLVRILPDLPVEQPYLFLREDRWLHLLWLRSRGKLTDRMRGTPDSAYARRVRRILDRANQKGTFHDNRKTCLTRWLEDGRLTPPQVQRLAGHANIETTMRYYYRCDLSRAVETARHIEVWNRNPMQAR
ncbi:MAG: site-specific integrase, partial [Armatimonadota bacterium]|nr:site-specific integrase [Armatimonadota bacterium]